MDQAAQRFPEDPRNKTRVIPANITLEKIPSHGRRGLMRIDFLFDTLSKHGDSTPRCNTDTTRCTGRGYARSHEFLVMFQAETGTGKFGYLKHNIDVFIAQSEAAMKKFEL